MPVWTPGALSTHRRNLTESVYAHMNAYVYMFVYVYLYVFVY